MGDKKQYIIGVDPVRGNFEWSDESKCAVVFKPDPNGHFVVRYSGRPQPDYETQVKMATEYFKNAQILCEECGEIGKHKPICSQFKK